MEPDFDPYLILGVSSHATDDEIQKAYRRLALTMHPDHNQHDSRATLRFQLVQRAYDLLRDSARRRAWESGESSHAGARESPAPDAAMREMDCPICGGKFAISETALKRSFHCLLCNAHLTMPGAESAPSPPPPPPSSAGYKTTFQANIDSGARLKTKGRIRPRGFFERLGWFGWLMIVLAVIRVLTWMLK